MIWNAYQDPSFSHILKEAELLLPDGVGILLAARLTGKRLPQRITGIDTGEWLLQYAAAHRLSVFLLGGKKGVAERAKQSLIQKIPTLNVCGVHHGYFDKDHCSQENQAVIQLIQDASPDLLFVCFGSPSQEKWIHENTHLLPSLRLAIGLGGALDVWSGDLHRAPKLIQICGLEWLWRVWKEPKRIRRLRYAPSFFKAVLRSKQESPTDF